MQDQPLPEEIIAAVARFLREAVAPVLEGALSFNARVAANALEMAARQLRDAPAGEIEELASLRALLGSEGDLLTLNAELSARLADGRFDLETPGVAEHLWRVTLAKIAVDQPTYWGYRAALNDRAAAPD